MQESWTPHPVPPEQKSPSRGLRGSPAPGRVRGLVGDRMERTGLTWPSAWDLFGEAPPRPCPFLPQATPGRPRCEMLGVGPPVGTGGCHWDFLGSYCVQGHVPVLGTQQRAGPTSQPSGGSPSLGEERQTTAEIITLRGTPGCTWQWSGSERKPGRRRAWGLPGWPRGVLEGDVLGTSGGALPGIPKWGGVRWVTETRSEVVVRI